MILDELFGEPVAKVKKIVRKNGKLTVTWKPVSHSGLKMQQQKVFFPISKERE